MRINSKYHLLRKEVEECIFLLSDEIRNYVIEPLQSCGRIFSVEIEKQRPWAILPILVFESISGSSEKALPLAASIQFFMAAGDVFDDIEDNDSPLSLCAKYGTAVTNNIATTLLVLGEKAIARLKDRNVDEQIIVHILDSINSYYLIACTGQHLDLLYENKRNISEDEYLNIINLKSASQIECSCYTAALLATKNKEQQNLFKEFGVNLGMMAQIINDLSGIINMKDILKRKMTLPVIFALNQSEDNIRDILQKHYIEKEESKISADIIAGFISDTGAIHYVTILLEEYRLKATDALTKLEQTGINIVNLKELTK